MAAKEFNSSSAAIFLKIPSEKSLKDFCNNAFKQLNLSLYFVTKI